MNYTKNEQKDQQRKLKLVPCSSKYWEFVRNLRNDERVQMGFIESVQISEEQQNRYMMQNERYYYICISDDKPAGYVGVINDDIRICTSPEFQNQGIASFMLDEIMKIFPSAFGKVKVQNLASRNLFKKQGFEEAFVIYVRPQKSSIIL